MCVSFVHLWVSKGGSAMGFNRSAPQTAKHNLREATPSVIACRANRPRRNVHGGTALPGGDPLHRIAPPAASRTFIPKRNLSPPPTLAPIREGASASRDRMHQPFCGTARSRSLRNHARANAQSRFTVRSETPRASAVLARSSPVKKRRRTTAAACGSTFSNR